jgi:hypothetical protein
MGIVLLRLYHVRLMSHPDFQLDRVLCRWCMLKAFFFWRGQISLCSERIKNHFFRCYFKIRQLAGSRPLSKWVAAFGHDSVSCIPYLLSVHASSVLFCLSVSTVFHVTRFLNVSPPKLFFSQRGCRNVLHKITPPS